MFSIGDIPDVLANVEVTGSTISGNAAASGGGILSVSGGLQVTDSTVRDNTADYGGGMYGYASTLLVTRSTISGNSALGPQGTGGGILAIGVLVLTDSTVSGNTANYGGGVYGGAVTTSVTGSTINGNSAAIYGGGLYLLKTDLTLSGTTVSGNSAGYRGGGIWVKENSAAITSSTITGNSADVSGGGIAAVNVSPELRHAIVARNTRGTALVPSDVTGSVALAFSLLGVNSGATITDGGGNIIGTAGSPVNPLLGPLTNNGGPTRTHALLVGSPAIDAGDPAAVMGTGGIAEFDQRGGPYLRIVDGDGAGGPRIDIGAFERQPGTPVTLVVDTLTDELDGSVADGDVSLRDAIAVAVPGATIEFAAALTSGGPATIDLSLGQLLIDKSLSIVGPGASLLSIDASASDLTPNTDNGDGSRVFNVDDGNADTHKVVAISGLTLTGGDVSGDGGAILSREILTLTGCTLSGNHATEYGGGIFCSGLFFLHAVTIADSTISGNAANLGGGIYAQGRVTLAGSTVSGNGGGGIFHASGADDRQLAIVDSTISGNSRSGVDVGFMRMIGSVVSDNFGPGIRFQLGSISITSSLITGNVVDGFGGGINMSGSGSAKINDSEISGNSAGELGGGIFSNVDINPGLAVADSSINNNTGGGIVTRVAPLVVVASTVSGNTLSGIYTEFSPVTVVESAISNNVGQGGIFINSGSLTLTRSVVSGNSNIYDGGGVYVSGSATITDSTISGNSSNQYGGGISQYGGGSLIVTGSTISGNSAADDGGGIYSGESIELAVVATTITRNSAGGNGGGISAVGLVPVLDHAIVAGNTRGAATPSDVSASVAAAFSLLGVDTGATITNLGGNLIGTAGSPLNPRLGPLANNGGFIKTHALLPGSPAIDAGDPAAMPGVGATPLFDQRGVPFGRVKDGDGAAGARIDMGAYESQGVPSFSPGDYNEDGIVNSADYPVWRNTLGQSGLTPFSGADGDGDGSITGADYDVWKSRFGDLLVITPPGAGSGAGTIEQGAGRGAEIRGKAEGGRGKAEIVVVADATASLSRGPTVRRLRSEATATRAELDDALVAWLASHPNANTFQREDDGDGLMSDSPTGEAKAAWHNAFDAAFELLEAL